MMLENKRELRTQATCCDDKGNLWFTSNSYNALFCLDLEAFKVRYVTSFEEKINYVDSLYTKAIYYDNKIILIPCVSEHITIYDIEKKVARYVFIEGKCISYNCIRASENTILLFPVQFEGYAWEFLLNEEKLVKKECFPQFDKKVIKDHLPICFLGDGYVNNKIVMAIPWTNLYVVVDLDSYKMYLKEVEGDSRILNIFQCGNECCFLSDAGDSCTKYDGEKEYSIAIPFIKKRGILGPNTLMAYSRVVYAAGIGNICIPVEGNEFRLLDSAAKVWAKVDWKRIKGLTENSQPFVSVVRYKDRIIFCPYQCATWLIYDCTKKVFYYENIIISDDEVHDIITNILFISERKGLSTQEMYEDDGGLSLEWYIGYIKKIKQEE